MIDFTLTITLLLGMIVGFILCEVYHLFYYRNLMDVKFENRRFNVDFGYLLIWSIAFVSLSVLLNIDINIDIWICIALFIYLFISETVFYDRNIKLKYNHNSIALAVLIGASFVFIIFVSWSFASSLFSSSVFEGADWFTDTFLGLIRQPEVISIISLMTIGAFSIIIGKARRSSAYATIGFFMIVALPIFSIFDTLLTDIDSIQDKAAEIYIAFQSEGLALIIYTVIMTIFYILLTSIIIAFTSLLDSVGVDD